MIGVNYFSVLDANKGFWQIKLNEHASKLTTFATPFGRFKFVRLPFGISIAPEIFHRTFLEIFNGISGLKIYIDDLIIYAKTKAEHDKILEAVLNRALEKGVRFNKTKCTFGVNAIKYIGHIISSEGIKIDDTKVEAIQKIPTPQNQKELLRFLGMATYVAKFIPNLSQLTCNLRQIIRKSVLWQWTDIHQKEFEKIKSLLSTCPVLQFFNEKEPITLSVDSSKDGMGAVILQNGAPISYASKSMSQTQQNYAQIEKEMLAIVFGVQRFHQYLYGKIFTIETDHKPLEQICKKPLVTAPLRLQRLLIMLQPYDYLVKYKPGSKLYFADALSRASYDDKNFNFNDQNVELQLDLIDLSNVSPQKYQIIVEETEKYKQLQALLKVIKEGWPIQKDILQRLHYAHLGINKTLAKANELVFWPFMTMEFPYGINSAPEVFHQCFKNIFNLDSVVYR